MALRNSQAYLGVLGKAPGIMRVSQAYISVLLRRHEFGGVLSQNISFTSDFEAEHIPGSGDKFGDVEQTLDFVQDFDGLNLHQYVSQSLGLTQDFNGLNLHQFLVQSLSFSQDFDGATLRPVVEQDLELVSEFEAIHVGPVEFDNTLALTDDFNVSIPVPVEFGHVMRFYNPLTSSYEGLDDIFSVTYGVKNALIEQTLSFAQIYGLAIEVEWSNELELVDEFGLPIVQELVFAEDWAGVDSKALDNELEFEESFEFTLDSNKLISQSITFSQTYKSDTGANLCEYQLPNPPVLGKATLTLTYGMTELILRNPIFNNTTRKGYTRIQRETRGGTLKIFADPIWPKTTTLIYSIEALPNPQEVLDFLEASLGQQITLLDHEDREWIGIITNPNTAVTDNGICRAECQLEFVGELV